jgi:two-component system OmpR family sensor kinase
VFERFYRADKSRSTGGNGLGLSICQAIITAHGGTIEVSSVQNVGTTITLTLPQTEMDPEFRTVS